MSHRWARWALVVVAIAAAGGACAWALGVEGQLRMARERVNIASTHAANARSALGDVRRGLAAMASPGQAAVGWSRRAVAGIDETRAQMTALATAAGHREAPRPALDVIERLGESERRLRDHAVGGKPLMAADVAFGEALPHVDELERQIADTLTAATGTADREVATLRDRQVAALAGALAALLLAALMLTPLPRVPAAEPTPAPLVAAPPIASEPLADFPLTAPAPAAATPLAAPPAAVDLSALAGVCADLAAVSDAGVLPAALDRAAAAIGARGLILWLVDADRRHLQIAAAAGYDARLLDRLGAVDVGDTNPTARAFASGVLVTTDARDGRPATATVPLAGPGGTCGVLAAEFLAGDSERQAASTSAARLVAAQLAMLVSAPPAVTAATPADDEQRAQG
jgi:hypothetical protein